MTRRFTALLVSSLLAAGLLAGGIASAPSAAAYPTANVDLTGHGFGHGRGLGQYGALGYAVDQGWSYKQILGHYYSNTTEGNIGNPEITVHLTRFDGIDTLVQQENGMMATNAAPGTTFAALRARRIGANLFAVDTAPTCAGPWTNINAAMAGPVTFVPTQPSDDHTHMLQACNADGQRWYRGQLETYDGPVTVNRLDMENYLKGVVPRESPASWGDLGGGRGMEALRAQAVAARSYAQGENRNGNYKTCDTTSCQVYGGNAQQINGGGFTTLEDGRSNTAVTSTGGEVRMLNGGVARTEFSSSTGGWSAGGTFPAVEDTGDDTKVIANPNHDWTASIPVGTIEAKYGKGSLLDVQVTNRNGLGADGGRVTQMRLSFSGGNLDVTGDDFRIAFGLKSNWFTVTKSGRFPYHVVTRDGGVFSFAGAEFHGSLPGIGVKTPARDITEGPGGGYWILGEDGGVFSFDVPFYGSMGGQRLNSPVVGMQATAARQGYWLVAGDGGIFTFGDAPFYGSTGNMRLNKPVVAMAPTSSGQGYWMVATDGGIFTFGDAPFFGSTGDIRLNQPVFAMAPTPSGNGYWLVARDGGIFTFGDATFLGSLPGIGKNETAVEVLPTSTGFGYLIVTQQGHVYAFGDAASDGGPADKVPNPAPSVGAGRVS